MDLPKLYEEKPAAAQPTPLTDEDKLKQLQQQIADLQKQTTQETVKPPQTQKDKPDIYGSVPKKVCAVEVVKHLKLSKIVAIGAIVGAFLILLGAVFGKMVSYGMAVLVIIPAAVYLQRVNKELVRLKQEYGV